MLHIELHETDTCHSRSFLGPRERYDVFLRSLELGGRPEKLDDAYAPIPQKIRFFDHTWRTLFLADGTWNFEGPFRGNLPREGPSVGSGLVWYDWTAQAD